MKPFLLCALSFAAIATSAQAGTMIKCVEAGGKISYQNQPCAPSARASKVKKDKQVDEAPPESDQLQPQEMVSVPKAPAVAAKPGRPLSKRELAAKENAAIEALRRAEMQRITGQQHAKAPDAGDDLK